MYAAILYQRPAFAGHIMVGDAAQIEFLVKELEIETGSPGRVFVVGGAERLTYRVQWQPHYGYEVRRLDEEGVATRTQLLDKEQLDGHAIGEALRRGLLFTPLSLT
jgi:hypothetical protein